MLLLLLLRLSRVFFGGMAPGALPLTITLNAASSFCQDALPGTAAVGEAAAAASAAAVSSAALKKAPRLGLLRRGTRWSTTGRGKSHHRTAKSLATVSSSNRFLTTFAGLPTTMAYGGTSFETTARAPTTAPSPIVTPDKMVAPAPIQQSLPMTTSPFPNGLPGIPWALGWKVVKG